MIILTRLRPCFSVCQVQAFACDIGSTRKVQLNTVSVNGEGREGPDRLHLLTAYPVVHCKLTLSAGSADTADRHQ